MRNIKILLIVLPSFFLSGCIGTTYTAVDAGFRLFNGFNNMSKVMDEESGDYVDYSKPRARPGLGITSHENNLKNEPLEYSIDNIVEYRQCIYEKTNGIGNPEDCYDIHKTESKEQYTYNYDER